MPSNALDQSKQKECGRVLFTGNGDFLIDDLIDHTPGGHQMKKCPPEELIFIDMLETFRPHLIVMCLMKETREKLHMYSALGKNPQCYDLPVIAIGNEEDCDLFKKIIVQKNNKIFVRPLNRDNFLKTYNQFILLSMELEKERVPACEAPSEPDKAVGAAVDAPPEIATAQKVLIKRIQDLTSLQGRKTILVVDDDVRMLNVIKLYLQDLYDIILVPSGKLALKFLSKKSADLVLLDYMMPDEDGPAVLQQIRENSLVPHIPVLFLTGVSDQNMVMRGLEFRPNGYLLKPVTRQTLLEKVTEIVLGLE